MKCPKCANTQKSKEGKTCTKCSYGFVFDPKSDGIADGKFMALLDGVSAKDKYYFTMNQLYARYSQGRTSIIAAIEDSSFTPMGLLGMGMAVIGGVSIAGSCAVDSVATSGVLPWVLGLALVGAGLAMGFVGRKTRQLAPARTVAAPEARLHGWVAKWEGAGRAIPKLLRTPSLDQPPSPYRERDIYDYGVERIVIVEHDLLVDLFVKNGFHSEQRALVISERGYPSYLVPHAVRLLEERADLPVLLLHDATPNGAAMRARVAASRIFPLGGRKLVDTGLFGRQVPTIKALEATIPAARGNAVPVDYLPFAAMAGGVAAVAATAALLTSSDAGASGSSFEEGQDDGSSDADFSSDASGDGDFG